MSISMKSHLPVLLSALAILILVSYASCDPILISDDGLYDYLVP